MIRRLLLTERKSKSWKIELETWRRECKTWKRFLLLPLLHPPLRHLLRPLLRPLFRPLQQLCKMSIPGKDFETTFVCNWISFSVYAYFNNKPLVLVQPPEFKEYEEWKWRGVGSLSVFLSIQDVRDSLKLGPGSRPGQDMSYHDNDLPSLRNINTHQQTWELHRQKYSRGGDWNIQRGLGDWTWFL